MTQGVFIDSFMPPHEGHQYLIDFARNFVEALTIVISHKSNDSIPLESRIRWTRHLFPQCRIESIELDSEESVPVDWTTTLGEIGIVEADYLFCKSVLGTQLSEVLDAHWVISDPSMTSLELESRSIREQPAIHWDRIPRVVRPYYLKKVCVFGPESTGKSTLCQRLANHFQTLTVPEYARTYLEHKPTDYELSDVVPVARGQRATELTLSGRANKIIFCDTDMLTTKIWSEWLFGECDPWVLKAIQSEHHDLYLLTSADVPWVEDEIRYLPNDRANFELKCEEELQNYGRSYTKISGDWEHRFETAVEAVEKILSGSSL